MQRKKLKFCILSALKIDLTFKKVWLCMSETHKIKFLTYYKIFNLIGVKAKKVFSDKKNLFISYCCMRFIFHCEIKLSKYDNDDHNFCRLP